MKRLFCALILLIAFSPLFSQDNKPVKGSSIGIHFFFNDFKSASYIASNSLSNALLNKKFGQIKEMSPGLAFSYLKGICSNLDFSASAMGSFLDYTASNGKELGTSSFLLELDASLHAKMLPDNYVVVPYLTAGVGLSKYKGYYGAVMPLGVGLQIKIFNGTFIVVDSQYRVRVTESTNNHFIHSIGIVGSLEAL